MAFGFKEGELYIDLLRKMELNFEKIDIMGLYELLDNYTEALKFYGQRTSKFDKVHYNVEDPNSMFIEKILHHINKRVYDWDHRERTKIYYG